MRVIIVAAVFLTMVSACISQTSKILVGPNILVSRESTFPKVEMMIAANPMNSKNLIGTAIGSDPLRDDCKIYTTFDGGSNWREISLPELPRSGSGDPQVAFAPDGNAYFSALGRTLGADAKAHFAVLVFRSEDGGSTWRKVSEFGSGTAPDHDQLAIDPRPEHAGNIYVSVLHHTANEEWNIGVFRSDDHGNTFAGPLHVATGAGNAVFSLNPVFFSDGSVLVPFEVFALEPIEQTPFPSREIYFSLSSKNGSEFSAPAFIRKQQLDARYFVGSPYANVIFAADTRSRQFRDRVYMVWGEAEGRHYHLKFSYSKDRGNTWSPVQGVETNLRPEVNQFRPAMAVNKNGVVGISWFDTRDSGERRAYREYFTASLDGGETFLPPVQVSSEESPLGAIGNTVLKPTIDSPVISPDGIVHFYFANTDENFPDGGDYMGITASADGLFHPLWADTRTGNFQAWTAAITAGALLGHQHGIGARTADDVQISVGSKLQPIFDPSRFDRQTGIEEIPIRFMNKSSEEICGPISVQIKDPATTGQKGATKAAQLLLNADNGKDWDDAIFDYSKTLGDFSCLEPGEVSGARTWKLKVVSPASAFVSIDVAITAVDRGARQ